MPRRSRLARGQAHRRNLRLQTRSHSSHKIISPFRERAFPRTRPGATTVARNRAGNDMTPAQLAGRADMSAVDSTYAWIRLFVALVLGTIGSVGMWSYVVVLPPVQADFGILRNARLDALHHGDDRLRVRRRRDGAACRPLRHRGPGDPGTLLTALGYHRCGLCAEHLGAGRRACGDRHRLLRHVRADRLGHVALVQEAARHRDRHRVMRQLCVRRDLAADRAAFRHQPTAGARRISASASSASSP